MAMQFHEQVPAGAFHRQSALRSSPSLHHPKLAEHIGHHAAAVLPRLGTLLCFLVRLHICGRLRMATYCEGGNQSTSKPMATQRTSMRRTPSLGISQPAQSAIFHTTLRCTAPRRACWACCAVHAVRAALVIPHTPKPLTQQRLLLPVLPIPAHNGLQGASNRVQRQLSAMIG